MNYPFVLVIGGSGFIGKHVVAKLSDQGYRIIVATRRFAHAKDAYVLPGVYSVVEADIHDDDALNRLVAGMDAVINLVGVLHSKYGKPYGPSFTKNHVDLPRRIVAACAKNGVHRYLHMSALGADVKASSMYLRSKADGEKAAFSNPAVKTTVFRPSVVFGEDDSFLNMFASMQKYFPIIPLAGANAKFQPIYVQDVAQAIVTALGNDHTLGHVYELAGPTIYTLSDLVKLAGIYSGHSRLVLPLSTSLGRLQAWFLEHAPGEPLMSRDNLDSMQSDNVAHAPIAAELGISPAHLEAVAPYYLGSYRRA